MNPLGGSGAIPAFRRAQRSTEVKGQSTRFVAMAIPQITAGTCSHIVRRQRSARKPPMRT